LHALAQLKHWRIKQEVCLISRRKVRGGEEKHWGLEKACVESFSNDLQLGLGSCFAGGTTASLSMLQSPIHQKACLFRKRKKKRQLQPLRSVAPDDIEERYNSNGSSTSPSQPGAQFRTSVRPFVMSFLYVTTTGPKPNRQKNALHTHPANNHPPHPVKSTSCIIPPR
jgi:hypothetical protein